MVKLTEIFNAKYYSPYKRVLLISTLLIVFVGVTVYYYSNFLKTYKNSKNEKNIPNSNRRATGVDVLFFHTDWCPHCKNALPTWHQFVEKYDNTVVNGYKVTCIGGRNGIDCSNADDPKSNEIRKKYNVESYPSIKMNKGETTVAFDTRINIDNLGKFVNSVCSG
jgi:thiol-disulfide isomerase/thioredoxin